MNDNDTLTTQQQTTTPTPEVNGGERLFTQSEVNKIISDRLTRERERLADSNEYKTKFETLQKELEGMKAAQARQFKETAYRALVKAALDPEGTGFIKESRLNTVIKSALVNGIIDSVELDDDGNVKNADQLKKDVAAEWPDYIVYTETRGADIAYPPTYMTADPIDERIAAAFKPPKI